MCTLAIYVRAFADFPLVVAANRDEFLARPTSRPQVFDAEAGIFGGRDEVARGTWLAVNRAGMVAALLNRRTAEHPDPTRRSRGQICLGMLRAGSASEARQAIQDEDPEAYNAFNLLVADAREAWVATNHGPAMSVTHLERGLHLVTNLDLDDPTCPRIAASYQLFATLLDAGAPAPASAEFRDRLREILSAHETPLDPRSGPFGNSLCLHSEEYGTRSSTLIFGGRDGRWGYFHANQAPCRAEYREEPVEDRIGAR